jgi:hypothetical protein
LAAVLGHEESFPRGKIIPSERPVPDQEPVSHCEHPVSQFGTPNAFIVVRRHLFQLNQQFWEV